MPPYSTSDLSVEEQKTNQRFNPCDPEMVILLRGLLHELRNPLSSILTAASLLQTSPSPSSYELAQESQMLLDVVKKESLRLNHILTEFAGYIKIPPPQPETFDLARMARAAIRDLQRNGVLSEQINVVDELPSSCPVWGDEGQICIAFTHILHNAGEAMPDGGELRLSVRQDETGKNIVLCVSDSGKGFTAESRDRAFQPFYSCKEHGIGLGLPSVLNLIEAANGRVWLEEDSASTRDGSTSVAGAATSHPSICFQLPQSQA